MGKGHKETSQKRHTQRNTQMTVNILKSLSTVTCKTKRTLQLKLIHRVSFSRSAKFLKADTLHSSAEAVGKQAASCTVEGGAGGGVQTVSSLEGHFSNM